MKDKTKNKIIAIGFTLILMFIFLMNLIIKDSKISTAERRSLTQLPEITIKSIFNGNLSNEFEKYAMDQFIQRDLFRSIKSVLSIDIFRQKDNNGLFVKDNAIYKMEYPLNENNVQKSADKINSIYNKYLNNMKVYYAIIPDKNHYLENDDHLKIDYAEVEKIMNNTLKQMQYISIEDNLQLKDYYRTDTHWKQENLEDVVGKIQQEMSTINTPKVSYQEETVGDFYGVYYGQLGLKMQPDQIKVLTNEVISNCVTYNVEKKQEGKIYDINKWKNSSDKYDIYLSGATPIITISNPSATTDRELILFRDSYGGSIAPLLIENYSKITLVDVRYISSSLLENYIEFKNQDVLFLYSTLVLNQNILK